MKKNENETGGIRDTIEVHMLHPSGVVRTFDTDEHAQFVYEKGVYEVRNIFTLPDGRRMALASKGNPIPHPSDGISNAMAMERQHFSRTLEDLSRLPPPSLGSLWDRIMTKLRAVPPWVGILIIVGLVLLMQVLK